MKNALQLTSFLFVTLFLASCYPPNTIVDKEEAVDESWANVQSTYQRRLDLVDNLVNTVKGAAEFEQETFTAITEARAGIQKPTQEMLADKEALAKFYAAQKNLQSQARMMFNISVENYPELRATEAFRDFMNQLEGVENRINTARTSYNAKVKSYNAYIQKIPGKWFARGKEKREYFDADTEAEKAPKVEF